MNCGGPPGWRRNIRSLYKGMDFRFRVHGSGFKGSGPGFRGLGLRLRLRPHTQGFVILDIKVSGLILELKKRQMSRKIFSPKLSDSTDIQALAGGDKPPPLQTNLYLKSSGGVYPRPYWVPRKQTSLRFGYTVQGFSPAPLPRSAKLNRKRN